MLSLLLVGYQSICEVCVNLIPTFKTTQTAKLVSYRVSQNTGGGYLV